MSKRIIKILDAYNNYTTGIISEKEYYKMLDEYLFRDSRSKNKQQTKKESNMGTKTTSKYGVKLTQKKADQIRKLFETSDKWTLTRLAAKFGVSRRQVGRVLDNEAWRTLETLW